MFDLGTEIRLLNLVTAVVACAAIAIVVYLFLR